MHGDDVLVTVDSDATVRALKLRVEEMTGVAVGEQRLIYQGKILDDAQELAAYSINAGHTVLFSRRKAANQPSGPTRTADEGVGTRGDGEEVWMTPDMQVREFEAFMRELQQQVGRRRSTDATPNRSLGGTADDADELLLNALFQAASTNAPHGGQQGDGLLRMHDDDGIARGSFHHEAIIENDGDCLELLIGFVIGFAIGILAALCLLERNGFASVRFKAGLFLGMTWCAFDARHPRHTQPLAGGILPPSNALHC